MADKVFKTRIQMKNNTTEYWDSVQNSFIPLFGEIIIYSDKDADGNLLPAKMKIGDGETVLANLPFSGGVSDGASDEASDGLTIDTTDAEAGTAALINADQLGGFAANKYLRKETYKSEITVVLSQIEWVNDGDNYTQNVISGGVGPNSSVIVSADVNSLKDYCRCGVHCVAQADEYLTFIANKIPKSDMAVNVLVFN